MKRGADHCGRNDMAFVDETVSLAGKALPLLFAQCLE